MSTVQSSDTDPLYALNDRIFESTGTGKALKTLRETVDATKSPTRRAISSIGDMILTGVKSRVLRRGRGQRSMTGSR